MAPILLPYIGESDFSYWKRQCKFESQYYGINLINITFPAPLIKFNIL